MQNKCTQTARVCPQCGTTFYRRPSLPFRYCSAPCFHVHRKRPLADRFWEKVDRRGPDACWLWTSTQDGYGYGQISRGEGRAVKAHRLSYELNVGAIPDGKLIRHRCDQSLCVNPAHLVPGTHSENLYDRYRLGRAMTHGPREPSPRNFERIERACPVCGLFFTLTAKKAQEGKGKYCSYPCSVEARYGASDIDRFWLKVDKSGECWLWTAAKHEFGYGVTAFRGVQSCAHRVAWIITNGPIAPGLQVCHNCPGGDQPACCRPDHMFLGTHADNSLDRSRKGRSPTGSQHFTHRHPELLVRGEQVHGAKLTADQVREIRVRAAAGEVHQRIADSLGVTQSNVSQIVKRVTWKHVD